MRKLILTLVAVLIPALALAQSGVTLPPGSNTLKSIHFTGYPALGLYSASAGTFYLGGTSGGMTIGDTAITGGSFSQPVITDALTFASGGKIQDGTSALVVGAGYSFTADSFSASMVADAAMQYGSVVMPDAATADRFDASTAAGTLSIGVVGGTEATAQGSTYPVILRGIAHCLPDEDGAFTIAHYAIISAATAGRCADSATISTIGKNIGRVMGSTPVSNTIDPTGCGGGGCINTTTGVITLAADVEAAGWTVGDPVAYFNSGGATPTGLTDAGVYWLLSVSTTTVTIAASRGGAVVIPTTQGNDATQYLQKLPKIIVQLQ